MSTTPYRRDSKETNEVDSWTLLDDGKIAKNVANYNLDPVSQSNPSLVLSFNAAGDVIIVAQTINGVTYTKTFSNVDETVASTQTISEWV